MARTHRHLMAGVLAPGDSDSFTVTIGTKVLVSSMILSAVVPLVACDIELFYTPSGGSEVLVLNAQIPGNQPLEGVFSVTEPWIVLMSQDQLRLRNSTPPTGPNLSYILSGIEFNPP